jgi:hypothetical protein
MRSSHHLASAGTDLVLSTRDDLKAALREVLTEVAATQAPSLPAVMTTSQAAKHLCATDAWVRTQVRAGSLAEAPPSNSRRLLITRESVERLLRNG